MAHYKTRTQQKHTESKNKANNIKGEEHPERCSSAAMVDKHYTVIR